MSLKTNPVSSGYSTGVINSNFKKIEEYVNDNLLNRDGVTPGEPNQMEVDLDMNSQDILNVGKISARTLEVDGTDLQSKIDEAERFAEEAREALELTREVSDKFGDVDSIVEEVTLAKDSAEDSAVRSENSAEESSAQVVLAEQEADRAESEADRAEAASNAAFINADVYPDVAAGRAAVANGEQFQVVEGDEIVRYRKDSASTQTEVARYPAASKLNPLLPILYSGALRNQFDSSSVIRGYWYVTTDDDIAPQSNSIVSGYIPVVGWDFLSISGLPLGVRPRHWAFFNSDRSEILSRGTIPTVGIEATIPVPDGAYFFLISVSQNSGLDMDLSTIQIEKGGNITSFTPFVRSSIASIGGFAVATDKESDGSQRLTYTGKKNLFNLEELRQGFAVNATASFVPNGESSLIAFYVGHIAGGPLTFSGLPDASNATRGRYYNFYTNEGLSAESIISGGNIDRLVNTATIQIPDSALWIAFSPRQNNPDTPDYSEVQIEAGAAPTAYEPFSPVIIGINGTPIAAGGESTSPSYSGGEAFLFGDSITQTTDVDNEAFEWPSGFVANWPDYALPSIKPRKAYSFAKSGAGYNTHPGLTYFQQFENQITAAASFATTEGISPRWLLVSLGTNDYSRSLQIAGLLGDYDTAMGKDLGFDQNGTPTTTLNPYYSLEAMRLGFARLRWHFPDTVMFCALPLQRYSAHFSEMLPWIEDIARMAGTYGFEVIDCYGESGIVREFESAGPGRDLTDGLHTNASGKRKQGRLIAARVMSRLTA